MLLNSHGTDTIDLEYLSATATRRLKQNKKVDSNHALSTYPIELPPDDTIVADVAPNLYLNTP
jgi:hypothetical protein